MREPRTGLIAHRSRKLVQQVLLVLGLVYASCVTAQNVVDHNARVSVDIDSGSLHVVDRLKFPSTSKQWSFLLNSTLEISVTSGNARIEPDGEGDEDLRPWKLTLDGSGDVVVSVVGVPALTISDPTRGHISSAGIYLPPNSGWLPIFPGYRVTFALSATLPDGWRSISQGDAIPDLSGGEKIAWRELRPQEGVWLLGGPFNKFEARGTTPRLIAWLRTADQSLASRYLKAARGWVDVYSEMFGTYPYGKLALVENFWETGYGMPSFSLMGEKVIRLPFIVTTAWPHEILHNWFGNSVYVRGGNWSEGLVAYLADHLIREDSGSGAAFRRDSLQKYRNFVDDGGDFPVVEFRSRHDAVTATVGYDKAMMIFHMLRQKIGDDHFLTALRKIFQTRRYLATDWDNLEKIFSEVSGDSLAPFFEQWITRTGVPELQAEGVTVEDQSCVVGQLKQTQTSEPFKMAVPVYVTFADSLTATRHVVAMDSKTHEFRFCGNAEPLRLDVDPAFDLARRLGPAEVPASVGEMLGSGRKLAVIPGASGETRQAVWRELASRLGATTALDSTLETLPADQPVWIFGSDNRFAKDVLNLDDLARPFALGNDELSLQTHGVFVARRNANSTVALLSVPDAGDPVALLSLLQYYDAYSFVAFKAGDRRASIRGQWPVNTSPLSIALANKAVVPALELPQRTSLVPR